MKAASSAGDESPTLAAEWRAWRRGARWVAGLDEVGRGALAGPVVAAAVVLPPGDRQAAETLAAVRDSKQLTAPARCRLYDQILSVAAAVGVGAASPLAVDVLGISRATALAMTRALIRLPVVPDCLLVDGFRLPCLAFPQEVFVGGDRRVLSIAAASIVAKVERDALMVALGVQRPAYGFDQHKGYGTAWHRVAIRAFGPTLQHRLSWAPLRELSGYGAPVR